MIPIFKEEIDAGIADQIQANASIAYTSPIEIIELSDDEKTRFGSLISEKSIAKANPNQADLFYIESVLASVGWNKNDDVFGVNETWNAKDSPIDKPFNYMHDQKDIIGHITSSKAIDFDGNIIDVNTKIEDLTNKFDIVVGSVIYKSWTNDELQERMDKIIAEIKENQWCVSMECWFNGFDYAVTLSSGEQKVVKRDKTSAFLSKHLRAYGGKGTYEDYKIGRLLRDFSFSGKGLVDKPANPRSYITNFHTQHEVTAFAGSNSSVGEINNNVKEETEIMAENTISKVQYDELKAELDSVKAKANEVTNKEIDGLKVEVKTLTDTVGTLETELKASKAVADTKDETITSLTTEVDDVKANLTKAQDEIKAAAVEVAKVARMAKLLDRGVEEDKAKSLVAKFDGASDEMFDALVDSFPKVTAKDDSKESDDAEAATKEDEKKKKDKKDKKEDGKAEEEALGDATVNKDELDLASAEEDEVANIREKAAAWIQSSVLRTTANIKED